MFIFFDYVTEKYWETALSLACFNNNLPTVKYICDHIEKVDIDPSIQCEAAVHWIYKSKSCNCQNRHLERDWCQSTRFWRSSWTFLLVGHEWWRHSNKNLGHSCFCRFWSQYSRNLYRWKKGQYNSWWFCVIYFLTN